jgi:hypothetical protein
MQPRGRRYYALSMPLRLAIVCTLVMLSQAPRTAQAENFGGLRGWQGVAFFCKPAPGHEIEQAICERAKIDARFLAVTSNIPFQNDEDPVPYDWLDLHVFLSMVGVLPDMGGAVSLEAGKYFPDAQVLAQIQTLGYLIVWDREVYAFVGGNGQEVVSGIAEYVERALKEFYADFLEANAPRR